MGKEERSWVGITMSGGRYELVARLGVGAMGSVYRAIDHNLDTEVAVKIPLESMLKDPDFAPRFDREIRALVKLRHPHIVKLFDVGLEDGFPYMIMELYRGGDLDHRRPRRSDGSRGAVSPASLAGWLIEIAGALDYAHGKGYIHRDIKPTNILFDEAHHAYLADFGVVGALANTPAASTRAMTAAGLVVGTPEYMAPEIIMGEPFDGRADQYSLAVMLYELLAGRRPFEGANATALIVQQSTQPPPPLRDFAAHVPEGLARLIHRGLEKQPAARFENCATFAREVVALAKGIELPESRRVPCPGCGASLKLLGQNVGKRLRCPVCKIVLRVSDNLSLELSEEIGALDATRLIATGASAPTPPPHAAIGTPPGGTVKPAETTETPGANPAKPSGPRSRNRASVIAVGAALSVACVGGLIYMRGTSPSTPVETVTAPPQPAREPATIVIPKSPPPPPIEPKRPAREPLPRGYLVNENFETDDVAVGELPDGWKGDLTVVKNPSDGRMDLSLANDKEAGSATTSFPDDKKIYGDFELRVRFLLPEVVGKFPDVKAKSTYLTISLTNSSGIDQDLFVEIGSTRDFGTVKVFPRLSDADSTAYETVDPFPSDRASEFILKRKLREYEIWVNGKLVQRLRFPKYYGAFDSATLALQRPVPEIRPLIAGVSLWSDREPAAPQPSRVSPPSMPIARVERANEEILSPKSNRLQVIFARDLLTKWEGRAPADLKLYVVKQGEKALALAEPGLELAWPFIDRKLEEPIRGDFRLRFDLKIPNVASKIAVRLRSGNNELLRIEIFGNETFSLTHGKEKTLTRRLIGAKIKSRNGFQLRREGDRFLFNLGETSLAEFSAKPGAEPFDGIGIRIATYDAVELSPLLYSLELEPLNR